MDEDEVSHPPVPCPGGGGEGHVSREVSARHTDNSRSPALDIAVLRQALCYLLRSNRGLKNLSPSKSRKSQPTKCRAFKTNRALNKHRISQNQWTVILLIHYQFAEGQDKTHS